jgi:hypothetical protein
LLLAEASARFAAISTRLLITAVGSFRTAGMFSSTVSRVLASPTTT